MNKTKKGLVVMSDDRQKQRKNLVGSLIKRFVTGPAADRRPWPRWRRSHETDSDQEEHPMPEILKVSPMSTSCEVTLISSADDGPETHHITVTHDGKTEPDDSYHMVLNPHRIQRRKYFDDDDEDHFGTTDFTHDSTTDLSSSLDLNGQDKTAAEALFASLDYEESHLRRESDDEECLVGDGLKHSYSHDSQEEVAFVASDQQYIRERRNFLLRKESVHYKALFDDSDSECDDDFSEHIGTDPWDNFDSWRCIENIESAHEDVSEKPDNQGLNKTLDTELMDLLGDESSMSSRDEDLPIEITVHIVSKI